MNEYEKKCLTCKHNYKADGDTPRCNCMCANHDMYEPRIGGDLLPRLFEFCKEKEKQADMWEKQNPFLTKRLCKPAKPQEKEMKTGEEKQIEELTAVIANMPNSVDCIADEAEYLYNAGYRKQIEGEWVKTDYITVEHGFVERVGIAWKCTNCLNASKRFHNFMNFCPNCGAKMKGGK